MRISIQTGAIRKVADTCFVTDDYLMVWLYICFQANIYHWPYLGDLLFSMSTLFLLWLHYMYDVLHNLYVQHITCSCTEHGCGGCNSQPWYLSYRECDKSRVAQRFVSTTFAVSSAMTFTLKSLILLAKYWIFCAPQKNCVVLTAITAITA